MSILCQECKTEFDVFLEISTELWTQIAGLDVEYLLCPTCIIKRIQKLYPGWAFTILPKNIPKEVIPSAYQRDKLTWKKCESNHSLIYFDGQDCPMCRIIEENKELRDMYMQEYSKNERWGKNG